MNKWNLDGFYTNVEDYEKDLKVFETRNGKNQRISR